MLKQAQIASAFADERTSEIIQLISDYQRAAKITVTGLKQQTGSTDLLLDCNAGKFPRRSTLLQPRGKYQFHGVGCCFEVNKRVIDIDFGPDGRFDGFDAWRLNQYAASAFEWRGLTQQQIEEGLDELETSKLIHRPVWQPSPHLYYFVAD